MKAGTKERLVKLMEILKNETNEEKMLSIDDIIERLQEEFQKIYPYGYEVDRRTVKTDIERLNKINFYIEEFTVKYGKKLYYYAGEVFEMYEIRILLDAVYSARSITNKERENLLEKIKSLTSKSSLKIYDSKLYIPQMVVSENALLKYYLNEIHSTIYSSKKLKFQYGSYDTSKNFNIHHNGDYYIAHRHNIKLNNEFIQSLKERFDRISKRVLSKWKDVVAAFGTGVISGFFSNIITVIINTFLTTSKRAVKIIREGFLFTIKSIKNVVFPSRKYD